VTASPTGTTHRMTLPWTRPPLTANQRLHWAQRHRATTEVRQTVGWLARATAIPAGAHATVTLTWAPGDRRRRDADNLVPTLKAACDGLVDAGVVPDDTPQWMTKLMPVITTGPAGMWLDVEVVAGEPAA
jgi:crossover junction endodeoxyribonuclease RusA